MAQVDTDRVRLYQFHPLAQAVESSTPDWLRRLEHLQRQLLGGRLDGAEDIALGGRRADAEVIDRLKAHAQSDPFGGCLAGYVLLRLGRREGLGDLASTIIEAAPTLSDAYILRGEYEAHKQNDGRAQPGFRRRGQRGNPGVRRRGSRRLVEGLRASGFVHPRGALVRYIFQRHARGIDVVGVHPSPRVQGGRLVITGADIGYEG